MKRVLHLVVLLFISINLFAQAPQKMTYQAVVRNSSNNLVVSSPVKMKISILQGSTTGAAVYSEEHNPTTNANGLVSIEIGEGTNKTGTFSSINWSNGTYFIKTETDPTNGNNLSIVGTSQLLSVPYALHSNCVSSSLSGDTLLVGCKKYIIPGVLETGVVDNSCGATNVHNPSLAYGSMTDQEGNSYKTIKIGTQTWMAENLKVSRYRNGDPIPNIKNNNEWLNTTAGAWCNYQNNEQYDCVYGKLYNSFSILDNRGVCPIGYRIPTNSDFETLITFLNYNVSGNKLKSTSKIYWNQPNTGNNESGFSGLPSGLRSNIDGGGNFYELGSATWIAFINSSNNSLFFRGLLNGQDKFEPTILVNYYNYFNNTTTGTSVRCIKE